MKPLSPTKRKKISIFSIYFTFFVDNLSWSIVFPIFAPLFLDPSDKLFDPSVSIATRTTILGVFLASFPLAQFFGAPIIGEFADRFGRKKALVYTILFACGGFALSGFSMEYRMLGLLFFSRVLTGLFSGNLSVCLAAIADLSVDEKARIKNFGYLSVVAGFSFIVGAFIGGQFSDSTLSSYFTPALPLWIATALAVINLIFVSLGFKETKEVDPDVKFDFLQGIHNIQEALRTSKIKTIYTIYFLFIVSFNILFQFTPVLVIENFGFSNSQIGDTAAFMGVCWAIGAGYVSRVFLRFLSPLRVLELSLVLFTILCALIILPKEPVWLIVILGLCVVIAGLAWPLCTNLISSRAGSHMQGKILGMSQSMQSLAMAVSPLVGVLTHIYMGFPFLIAAFTSLIAALFYFKVRI